MKAIHRSCYLLLLALALPLAADPLSLANPLVGTAVYDPSFSHLPGEVNHHDFQHLHHIQIPELNG